jgi:hypothetical protein
MTAIITNVLSPTPAVPELVIYKERPPLMQVDARAVAKELLTTKDFKCFDAIMVRESHWKDYKNPTSDARGVGQLLNSTYRNLGMKRSKSTVAQTVAALAYIGRKYGSGGPCAAWSFWKSHSYY